MYLGGTDLAFYEKAREFSKRMHSKVDCLIEAGLMRPFDESYNGFVNSYSFVVFDADDNDIKFSCVSNWDGEKAEETIARIDAILDVARKQFESELAELTRKARLFKDIKER